MEAKQQHSPNPPSSSSSLLRDISNFKTPKHPSQNPNLHSPHLQFFTASKQTPRSSSILRRHRPSLASSSARSKVSRRLKEFELEQCKSARKAQIDKEKSLKSLAKSLTVWLNFLLQNPVSCGCDLSKMTGQCGFEESDVKLVSGNGKRESSRGGGVGVDTPWRCPKRQRDSGWRGVVREESTVFSNSKLLALQSSLRDVCSFDDLKERMKVYLSLGSCKEIFNVMTQVTKNIDEGRLKMKPHCPIVTDVGLKEKASRILMCYNPIWLRIGLYIIFGGDSLLSDEDINSEKEIAFLKMVIEKQFFSHAGLARVYAYNKLVEGLYRPGYFEALGNVILKRFLLLVLVLDRAKSQSCLPIKYGIDGLDGGSPLLFTLQPNIKSSCQLIHDFLSSDVMHGEGNVLAHLLIVGYKVSYLQSPFNEYDFRVKELFEDLQDGVRLCRAIQLLQHDASILMKMLVPSDTRKKNVVNCGVALQHLKQAGVPLFDGDGSMIVAEDIVSGDKELTLSLLWNIFVHLQLPLLINKTLILEEISRIQGVNAEHLNNSTLLDMLLNWIQAICKSYDFKVDNFASLVDGKAMWCLLDYYFRKELNCSCSLKDIRETSGETSIMSVSDYTDAVHNFILSQKLTTLLGNFPEVLQVSDILEHNGPCNSQSVIILLVFLSFQLLVRKNTEQLNFHKLLGFTCQSPERRRLSMDQCFAHSEAILNQEDRHVYNTEGGMRNFKAIMAWWQDMAMRNKRFNLRPGTPPLQFLSTRRSSSTMQRENAAKIIQSRFRQSLARNNYLRIKNAVTFLQTVIRAWLAVKKKSAINKFCTSRVQEFSFEKQKQSDVLGRYITYMVDRHNFVKLKRFATIIEHATRAWISRRHHGGSILTQDMSTHDVVNAAIVVQKCIRGSTVRSIYFQRVSQLEKVSHACEETEVNDCQIKAASTIQLAWKKFLVHKSLCFQNLSATKIQTCYRGWLMRKSFVIQNLSATKIQSCYRGWLMRKRFIMIQKHIKAAFNIQLAWKKFLMNKALRLQNLSATKIQSCYRGWFKRKSFVLQKQAALKIQSIFQCLRCLRDFQQYKIATRSAIIIQSHTRGWIARRVAYRLNCLIVVIQSHCRGWLIRREIVVQKEAVIKIQSAFRCIQCQKLFDCYRHAATEIQRFVRGQIARRRVLDCFQNLELGMFLCSVLKLQRWWRVVLMHKSRSKSAIIIQSHIRGWIARQEATRVRHCIIVIQSYWKGYLARKASRGQLLDLRLRLHKSAANVDDSMRIINRLLVALSDLLSMKSVSGILHTCATLDMATKHSQKCCEKLVEAGAVDTLLKLIRSVSRSIPDQEVLKHALSTLRNLARYSHLTEVLIRSRGSVETILWELLRNKEEGYFIASELLRKICLNPKGVEAARNSPALLKRLHNLVEDLTRKTGNEKRNARGQLAREQLERRLREAVELLNLITNI
ncbi:abnormal spindle-like microcephaly-associated protein homolog isoform X3 [Camellia sinensis]|uniref:abnormal spindle-like microcephaly-associated protein homolog isoform X3 n=1 Tax=Camellia sinensis TaxID=4442 RepID=UPI0010362817|nr:abnormal spindle-like microcephaly-associated protein homolog isoform X3 [Camellia sinensis]